MKIIFVPISLSGYLMNSASERLRCRWLAPYLNADIYDRTQDLDNYDVIIYNKGFYPQEFRTLAKRYQNKLQILDSTEPDWLFYPEIFEEMASYCHILTSSTLELAEELKQFGDSYHIPDRQELSFYKIQKKHKNVHVKLVWFGYIENFKRINFLIDSIDNWCLPLLVITNRQPAYGGFIEWALETSNENIIKGDIVLNPLAKYKSNNKTTSFSFCSPFSWRKYP